MKNHSRYLVLILIAVLNLTSCGKDDEKAPPAPTISDLTPQSGATGTQVTITGTNFSTTANENTVTFHDGIPATVTAATAAELIVIVPIGAATGKITVMVNGQSAVSGADFTVSEAPSEGVFRKGDKIYVINVEVMYKGKRVLFEKDSVLSEDPAQEVYHLLKKQDDVFYLVEIKPSEREGNKLIIINSFNRLWYDDANYLRTDLRKLPLPFTEYSYSAADRKDRQVYAVKRIVDSKGFINKAAINQMDIWEDVARKTVGSVVKMEGGGSGWFIDKDLILTNQHVVGAITSNGDYTVNRELEVRFFDGRITWGRTWFASENHDVALVKLNQSFDDVNLLSLSNSTALKGELVLNIGGPNIASTYGSHLAILGVVDRSFSFTLSQPIHMSTISGQSGSPVFNARGEVLGMLDGGLNSVTIREDVNYNDVSSSSPLIYADSRVIETPYIGPISSSMVSNKTMLRLVSFWLKAAGRNLPDQRLKLTRTYTWNAAEEEFYAKYDIGFPYEQIPEINKKITSMLKSIATIQKRLSDPQSRISSETVIIYDTTYLVGLNYFPYEVGDVMDVILYNRQVREATIVAKRKLNGNQYNLYQLKSPFDEGDAIAIKEKTAEVKSSEPLLTLGRSYNFPYPGNFQVNPVMYENRGLKHQNALTDRLPLFNLEGEFIGYSTGFYTVDHSFDKGSRLFIRSVIPVAFHPLPLQLEKAENVFSQFSQLKQ
ncbi:MAG: trypsin-like peptidase domain-containing protein [Ekhidna sp.]|nr:trypsin-like peptidase domain-containing protein [Ekhidna sp.]